MELTNFEKEILANIDPKYNYITRDKNGDLFLWQNEPEKAKTIWSDEKCGD